MYLVVNFLRHIAILGRIILLTASRMISNLWKYMGSPPYLLVRL